MIILLRIENIYKSYGKKQVLFGLDHTFESGIYGLLGPNGAGKSTLIQIMTGNLKCEQGKIFYKEKDIKKAHGDYLRDLGYVPQVQGMYEMFSALQFLGYMASLKGIPKRAITTESKRVLEVVGLAGHGKQKLSSFSGGMKQRILIAQALLGDPKILILDEPTAGLDPKERIRIRNFISKISENRVILFATHVVSDLESIAREILLLGKGQIRGCGSPKELCAALNGRVFSCETDGTGLELLERQFLISNVQELSDGRIQVRVIGERDLSEQKYPFTQVEPNLQEVYLDTFSRSEEKG